MEKNIRKHLLAYGRVQGVGFRYFVYTKAKNLSLSGFAKNLSDGSVKIELEGSAKNVLCALDEIKKGNNFIQVDRIEIEDIFMQNDDDFLIM